jgi:transcription termination factor Rho
MLAPPMAGEDLADRHLAELHALAARAGVPGYRLLRRDELVERIRERGGDGVLSGGTEAAEEADRAPAPAAEPREERPREQRPREEAETERVTGVLDVLPQRYGFMRLSGLVPAVDDVYISASQIRRCELRTGDQVAGPAREPGRGERYRALVHVDLVNGADPSEGDDRPDFEQLTPVAPRRRLRLELDPADVLTRAVDLLVPIALGQRLLVGAAPRSGRTTLLRGLSGTIQALEEGPRLIVLLVDERPEEATAWEEALPEAEMAAATADMKPADQGRIGDLALARAKRIAESGEDVVLVCDSLSRLAVAHRDPGAAKALFGAGRQLAEEGAGSLTVIATVLVGSEEDEDAVTAVATTENALVRLDPELAASGVYPALRPDECRASDEEALRGPEELDAVRRLRASLAGLEPEVAAATLRERIEATRTNAELLASI